MYHPPSNNSKNPPPPINQFIYFQYRERDGAAEAGRARGVRGGLGLFGGFAYRGSAADGYNAPGWRAAGGHMQEALKSRHWSGTAPGRGWP